MEGKLNCNGCGASYPLDTPYWRCGCGHFLDIEIEAQFPREKILSRPPGMWRYREAIPIGGNVPLVTFGEGFTPMLAIEIAGRTVLVKQEHLFPSGSYKDRGASVLVTQIKHLGISHVVEDSSGNAGAAMATYCANAGIECDIYVPASTSEGKLAQVQAMGARLYKIPGSREDTATAVMAAANIFYYASHTWNPFFFQGTKTFAFEVCEQMGWQAPDAVILAVGNGSLLLGAYMGFSELFKAGIISRLPRLIGVQAANCAPLATAWQENRDDIQASAQQETYAEGIAIRTPLRGKQILEAIRQTRGTLLTVSEPEIRESLEHMCRKGFYIEPTSAATIAGVKKFLEQNFIENQQNLVTVFSGHGLKTGGKIARMLEKHA